MRKLSLMLHSYMLISLSDFVYFGFVFENNDYRDLNLFFSETFYAGGFNLTGQAPIFTLRIKPAGCDSFETGVSFIANVWTSTSSSRDPVLSCAYFPCPLLANEALKLIIVSNQKTKEI